MLKLRPLLLIATLLSPLCIAVPAAEAARLPRQIELEIWQDPSFMRAHPDLDFRLQGQRDYELRRYPEALAAFRESARFADKLSQAMVAEMHWRGLGVPVDRATAYAWMDLAAERGFLTFLGKREHYWKNLSEPERERALAIGELVHAEFGDELALKRIALRLRRGKSGSVGRTTEGVVAVARRGERFSASAQRGAGLGGVAPMTSRGGSRVTMSRYYDPNLWEPKRYVAWHRDQLEFTRRGLVIIGPPQLEQASTSGEL